MYLNLLKRAWNNINNFFQNRVLQFGQQYIYFAIFGTISYPLSYIYRVYYANLPDTENLTLRLGATILCALLLFYKKVPKTLVKYLPLYWYFTLTFSIPFLGVYLLLQNHLSIDWIINMGIGFFMLILLVDWLMFIILSLIGIPLAFLVFFLIHGKFHFVLQHEHELGIYLYIWVFICGVLFSSKKQQYQTDIINKKSKINEKLIKAIKNKSQDLLVALDDKKHFLQNFSHELRTPLHSILGLSEQLNINWEKLPNPRIKSILSMIYSSAFNLSEMVNNIINLSFYTSEKAVFTFKKTNFKNLILSCIESNKPFLETTGRQISMNLIYDKNVEENITIDSVKMQQVLNNLISNSIKYSKPTSKKILIEVKNQASNIISCSVIDDGIGIPKGEEKFIFNAFVRASNSKDNKTGKGLGLSIAKEIINGHNGNFEIKSNYKGTAITFTIPLENKNIKN